jgi:hypothetical protein
MGRTTTNKPDEESLERFNGHDGGGGDGGSSESPTPTASTAAPLGGGSGGGGLHPPRAVIVAELMANVFFVCGTSSFLIFSIYEFHRKARTMEARYAYVSAFVCNFLSGFVEFVIDGCNSQRRSTTTAAAAAAAATTATIAAPATAAVVALRHGRYSANAFWNLCISALFMTGTILDVVAFFLWDQFHFLKEGRVLYAGSHTWLLSALVVLWAKPPSCNWNKNKILERTDDLGNILFLFGVVIDCVVRYLDDPTQQPQPDSVHRLEFVSAPLWLCCASCYISADLYRLMRK